MPPLPWMPGAGAPFAPPHTLHATVLKVLHCIKFTGTAATTATVIVLAVLIVETGFSLFLPTWCHVESVANAVALNSNSSMVSGHKAGACKLQPPLSFQIIYRSLLRSLPTAKDLEQWLKECYLKYKRQRWDFWDEFMVWRCVTKWAAVKFVKS